MKGGCSAFRRGRVLRSTKWCSHNNQTLAAGLAAHGAAQILWGHSSLIFHSRPIIDYTSVWPCSDEFRSSQWSSSLHNQLVEACRALCPKTTNSPIYLSSDRDTLFNVMTPPRTSTTAGKEHSVCMAVCEDNF